jgi:hypothetical protein
MRALATLTGLLTMAFLMGTSFKEFSAVQAQAQAPQGTPSPQMNFFITSAGPGKGADLGGLIGADRHCATLAAQAGATDRTWRAYLSTQARPQVPAVHARNRIGTGPWYNAKGVMIAMSVDDLHSDKNNLTKETQLTEKGTVVNGRGDTPNMHDILTGSALDGRAVDNGADTTCNNWTSSAADGSALVGHHDRQGGGENATSWNSAHASKGCSQQNLQGTGGNGLFYCFATD